MTKVSTKAFILTCSPRRLASRPCRHRRSPTTWWWVKISPVVKNVVNQSKRERSCSWSRFRSNREDHVRDSFLSANLTFFTTRSRTLLQNKETQRRKQIPHVSEEEKYQNIKTSCCWYSWGGFPAHSWSLSPKHWRSRSGEKGFQSSFGEKNMIIEIEFNRKVGQSNQRLVEKWKYLKSWCQVIAEVLIQLVL